MTLNSARSNIDKIRLNDLLCATVIALAVIALYVHTLHVPWYLDDNSSIVENPLIRDLKSCFFRIFSYRGVAIFSFALNYRFGGLSLPGFHLVNISIHLLASWLVFLLLKRAVPGRLYIALSGSLIFAIHPLQTQAVTYVVQRMASLSALLFLLSLYLFVRAQESFASGLKFRAPNHLAFYLGSLTAGVLAIFTKENTAVLPFALLLFARFFLPCEKNWRPLLKYLAPYLLACGLAIVWLFANKLLPSLLRGETLTDSVGTQLLVSSKHNSPLYYFITELSVLWVYIRMLFLPFGQALDHNYPIVETLVSLKNVAAFAGLAALGYLSFALRNLRPLISCGIAWFFLTLAIESSLLPLDPLFEHRLYLPMFGFVLAVLGLLELLRGPRQQAILLCLSLLLLGGLTISRNHLWSDPVSFLEENLRKVTTSERVRVNLARNYIQTGRVQRAETLLLEAIAINPDHDSHFINLSKVYAEQGRYPEALRVLQQGLAFNAGSVKLHNNLGGLYDLLGQRQSAIASLNKALTLDPHFAPAYINLGIVYGGLGDWEQAERLHRRAIEESSQNPQAYYNLGLALYKLGRPGESLPAFRQALRFKPEYVDALFMAGLAAMAAGDHSAAVEALTRLQELDVALATKLRARMAGVREP